MSNKILLFLFAMVSCSGTNAQISFNGQLEDAKFNIVKKTIEFLSTDTLTFNNVKSNTCSSCRSFDDLKKFAEDNNLINAGKNVIDQLAVIQIDTSSRNWNKSLQQFGQLAHDKITGAEKEKRKQLKGYNDYVASLNKIITGVVPDEEAAVPMQAPPQATVAETKNPISDTTGKNNAVSKSVLASIFSPWILYGVTAALLGLVIYLAMKNKELKSRLESAEKNRRNLKENLKILQNNIQTLTARKKELQQNLEDANKKIETMELYAKSNEGKKRQPAAEQKTEAPATTKPLVGSKPPVQKPKPAPTITKFAKYADLVDGFSNAELIDKPDDETIFEILLKSNNTGEYKIIENEAAQKYALMNVQYFLGKTCKYDTFPMEKTTIQTDSPGVIKLIGSKWAITTPAKISFV